MEGEIENGFLKAWKPAVVELAKADPDAFALLAIVAAKAKRAHKAGPKHLQIGQALLRGEAEVGMTEKGYRGAKQRLEKRGLASFTRSQRGTLATILNTEVFDINQERGDQNGNQEEAKRAIRKNHKAPVNIGETEGQDTMKGDQNRTKGATDRADRTQNHQAGVDENAPKKPRRSGGRDGDKGERCQVKGALVPKFAPVRLNLFPDEYAALEDAAESQIESLKADQENYQLSDVLTSVAADDVKWLEDLARSQPEKADKAKAEADAIRANQKSYQRLGLKPEAKAAIAAWRGRIVEIKRALSGAAA